MLDLDSFEEARGRERSRIIRAYERASARTLEELYKRPSQAKRREYTLLIDGLPEGAGDVRLYGNCQTFYLLFTYRHVIYYVGPARRYKITGIDINMYGAASDNRTVQYFLYSVSCFWR